MLAGTSTVTTAKRTSILVQPQPNNSRYLNPPSTSQSMVEAESSSLLNVQKTMELLFEDIHPLLVWDNDCIARKNEAINKLRSISYLNQPEFVEAIYDIVSNMPVAGKHCRCFAEEDDHQLDDLIQEHSDGLQFCQLCSFTYCSECIHDCYMSSANCKRDKKKTEQKKHKDSIENTIPANHKLLQCFHMINILISNIKKWCHSHSHRGIEQLVECYGIVLSFTTTTESTEATNTSPLMNRVYFEPFALIFEKLGKWYADEERITKFTNLIEWGNSSISHANSLLTCENSFIDQLQQLDGMTTSRGPLSRLIEFTNGLEWKELSLENPIECTVIGIPNSGKSTFINAILQEDFLPTYNSTCTISNVQLLFGIERKVEMLDSNNEWKTIYPNELGKSFKEILDEFCRYSCINPDEPIKYHTLKIHHNNPFLKSCISFTDSPGFNDIKELSNGEQIVNNGSLSIHPTTLKYINRSSIVLLVIDIEHVYTRNDPLFNYWNR